MGWPLRMFQEEGYYFVTSRCFQGRLLLRPSAEVNEVVGGVLAKAVQQSAGNVQLHAFTFASNHFHLLVWTRGVALASFMQYLRQPLQEGGTAGGLEWRLLGAALLSRAGARRHSAGGAVALRAGPWSEGGLGAEECRVAGTHVSTAVAGAGEATVPVVQLDEALERTLEGAVVCTFRSGC